MVELAVFTIASKVLSTLSSPVIKMAYEKGLHIWEAKDDLEKLRTTITTIQAVLGDAEKKQQNNSVKDWIKRLKSVLYDADDLFDEVLTDDLLKQQITKGDNKLRFLKKVRVSCSKLNPIVSRNSIADKVKTIRKTLFEISDDIVRFRFVPCEQIDEEIPTGLRRGQDPGSFVHSENVIGRDEDKRVILEMLLNESDNTKEDSPLVIADSPLVIVIVGIGGMGKTTLAQLVYNDDKVEKNFEKRWFACISDTSHEKEVIGRIFQSMCEGNYNNFTLSQLQAKIRESVARKKFLLVLDDVWDDDRGRWMSRMSLLRDGAKGSRIIVTTRSTSVATGVDGLKTHSLGGLSEDKSWELFRKIAFSRENENDPRRVDLGREILKQCKNVPLAIRSIASLLSGKNTIAEWESVKDEELPKVGQIHEDGIMPVLKISYAHLPSDMKPCFAYCSLFPKDHIIVKQDLIYLWIAQGYIKLNNEETGHSYFMHLLRRGFFQEVKEDDVGEIESCKMHDLIHDLAQHVAGEESITLTTSSSSIKSNFTRHVSVGGPIDGPHVIRNTNRLRSFVFTRYISDFRVFLDQLLENCKFLRSLSMSGMKIESVPSSIGELKHLRYLDISDNEFACLPDSMTNLLNLLALDLHDCFKLQVFPDKFRKLMSLRYLNINGCIGLKDMPPGIGEMTCLHYLSDFRVKVGVKVGVKALVGLELRGKLSILFDREIEEWDGDGSWQLPVSPQQLLIQSYPGMRIPHWDNGSKNCLVRLCFVECRKVKYLPPIRCLPNLKILLLIHLRDLEYMEEEGDCSTNVVSSTYFPCLEKLGLYGLHSLKGWHSSSGRVSAQPSFPSLSSLDVEDCPELKSFPPCPHLKKLELRKVGGGKMIQQLLSKSLQSISLDNCNKLMNLTIEALPTLRLLHIVSCIELKFLDISHLDILEKLTIQRCEELELWEENGNRSCQLDWDSLPNLRELLVSEFPPLEKLPGCLRDRHALGLLTIRKQSTIIEPVTTLEDISELQ